MLRRLKSKEKCVILGLLNINIALWALKNKAWRETPSIIKGGKYALKIKKITD